MARLGELKILEEDFPEIRKTVNFWLADTMNFSSDKDARMRLETLSNCKEDVQFIVL
jgi:hypothetical protein